MAQRKKLPRPPAWIDSEQGLAFTVSPRVRDGLPLRAIACGAVALGGKGRKRPERSSAHDSRVR